MENSDYDVIVVGAGHAGCEAGLAAARLGKLVLVLTIELESVAMMPCNPAIGGTGKGQLVKEIDALGGEMGVHIDKTFIQSRMLNRSKGPAVWSPRAQADKQRYHDEMIRTLEAQPGLTLEEGEVVDIIIEEHREHKGDGSFCVPRNTKRTVPFVFHKKNRPLCVARIAGVVLSTGERRRARAVVLATGTYLGGLLHISDKAWRSGPSGLKPSYALADSLRRRGFSLRRFKTGTPARADASTLNYAKMKEQKGDDNIEPFSYLNYGKDIGGNRVSCWLTWTNPRSHEIVAENIDKTAPYGGHTTGTGPRYCLSIEDKVSRFPERERHQLFLEPEGLATDDVYIQGMSTSLPEDIQREFYRSIAGLEHAEFTKWAYSIEYDCLDPLALAPSLAYRGVAGLYCAGQFNGTSGYEEAAAQGLIAGLSAARHVDGKAPWTPRRDEAYIGVLIDDLVTKGTDEPYRVMTSRAEFRLVLRQDNADLRLTEHGHRLGLATEERYNIFLSNKKNAEDELKRLKTTYVKGVFVDEFLARHLPDAKRSPTAGRLTLADLLKRPGINYADLAGLDPDRPRGLSEYTQRQAEIQIKYEGYIAKQNERIEQFKKLENKRIPEGIDYRGMKGLRIEAAEKLDKQRPPSVGMASRISGVSPADISVLLIHLARQEHAERSSTQRNTKGTKHKEDGRLCEKSVIAATEPQSHPKSIDFQEIPDQVRDDGSVYTQSDGSFVSNGDRRLQRHKNTKEPSLCVLPSSVSILTDTLAASGVPEAKRKAALMLGYMKLVLKQNEVMNLTAVTDEDDFVAKHLLDSLAALGLPELEAAGRVVDVGTGAGFPGVPLAIAYPGKDFLLIDSLRKRVDFLDEACAKLGIENVRTLHARAEDAARMNEDGTKSVKRQLNEDDTKSAKRQLNEDSTKNAKGQPSRTVRHRMASPCHSGLRPGIHPPLREGFDLAVCRAVGHIAVLCEYCLPLVRVGGAVYAYKSESQAEEAAESAAALATLGASARVEVISADELFKHKRDGRLCEKSVIAATVECHAAEPLHSSMCEVQRSGSSCTSASEPQSHFKSIDFQEIPDQVRDDGSVFTQSDGSFCVATSAKERAQAAETPRHIIMVIKKERPTPDKYPRRPGAPAKSPL